MAQNKIFRSKFHILPKSCPRPRITKHGAYMSKDYRDWQEEFSEMIWSEWNKKMKRNKNPYDTNFYLFLKVHNAHSSFGDVDNIAKAILDTLQETIITNDKLCDGLYMTQFTGADEDLIELRLVTIDRWTQLSRQTHINYFDWLNLEPPEK